MYARSDVALVMVKKRAEKVVAWFCGGVKPKFEIHTHAMKQPGFVPLLLFNCV
jgi:hypothetical protein